MEKRHISPKNRLIWVVLAKELNETKGGRPKDLMSLGRADEMLSCNTTTLRRGFAHLVLSSKESIDMYYHSRFFLIELELVRSSKNEVCIYRLPFAFPLEQNQQNMLPQQQQKM